MTPKRHVIPFFVPHLGCPNNCVFCNQRHISGQARPVDPETINNTLKNLPPITDTVPSQIAFYGGSFTAIPVTEQTALLKAAAPFLEENRNAGIRISTRPDCIDEKTLVRLKRHGVTTVELGAQSMCDDVLEASGRGHMASDTEQAARLVKEAGFELILQMMTGLPRDTDEKSKKTAERLIALKPDGVRIYPTVVIRGTRLYDMWRLGAYKAHTVEDAVDLCAGLFVLFEKAGIPIVRLGLNPSEDLSDEHVAAGAYHPAFGELVLSRVFLKRAEILLKEWRGARAVTLGVAKNRVSVMTGQHRANLTALQQSSGIAKIAVAPSDVGPGEIVIMSIENTPQKDYNS